MVKYYLETVTICDQLKITIDFILSIMLLSNYGKYKKEKVQI